MYPFCSGTATTSIDAIFALGSQLSIIRIISFFKSLEHVLIKYSLQIAFELDLNPSKTEIFIEEFRRDLFGINYDIGNSASLGFIPYEEIDAYGCRVINVHVKDRPLGGKSVRLGQGAADFQTILRKLSKNGYDGNYILQTARAIDEDHESELLRNADFFRKEYQNARK